MADATWELDSADGELTVRTGVVGRAARMGHRLTLRMGSWRARATWSGTTPVAAGLVVDVDSLEVQSGEGGVTPLTNPEKGVARANGLKSLDAKRFPHIEFSAETITPTDTGYLLAGPLQIHGVTRPVEVELAVSDAGDAWKLTLQTEVTQSDYGVKPYSMLGAMKVADTVTVAFEARKPKNPGS
jgi:polyisoprenoid-binding protein YceI